jgi:hypothetical protein
MGCSPLLTVAGTWRTVLRPTPPPFLIGPRSDLLGGGPGEDSPPRAPPAGRHRRRLRRRRLDPEDRTLVVAQTVVRGRHGRIGFGAPKSEAGWRNLAVPAGLVAMLMEHIRGNGLAMSDRHALLFTAAGGGFLR